MKKLSAVVLAMGLCAASVHAFADDMGKNEMDKGAMSHSSMSHDNMSKDHMSKDGMKKSGSMSKDDDATSDKSPYKGGM